MSMIFQSYAIWPNMTVAENVGFGLELRKLPREEIRRRVDEILDVVQLGASARSLSGRAQRRPAAARRARPRDRGQARGAAARRAAVQPRRQPARGDALRDPPPARRVQHHHGVRHARPGRGDGDVRPHRGDEPWAASSRSTRRTRSTRGRARASSPGFIGRTNFLEGKPTATGSTSAAFRVPAAALGVDRTTRDSGAGVAPAAEHPSAAPRTLVDGRPLPRSRRRPAARLPRRVLGLPGDAARTRRAVRASDARAGRVPGRRERPTWTSTPTQLTVIR